MKKLVCLIVFILSSCTENTDPLITQHNKPKKLLEIYDGSRLGIDFEHDAAFSDAYSIYEPLGSGVAVIDYNNDGQMDVFIPQYGDSKGSSKLYKNDNTQFIDVTKAVGLDGINDAVFASVADVNNDGSQDLLVGGKDKLELWLNKGDNSFAVSNTIITPPGKQFYTGASWFDLDLDGFLDLWVINYVDDTTSHKCYLTDGSPDYCPPKPYRNLSDLLLINHHGNSFTSRIQNQQGHEILPGLGVVADDFDHNGWPDIYVANDGVANQLLFNNKGVFSADKAKSHGAAFNLMGESESSMGIAVGDINNDTFSDLYITHFNGETNTLYINEKGFFMDQTIRSKLAQKVRPYTGFGTLFTDLNTDNQLDIVVVNGSTQLKTNNQNEKKLTTEPIQIWLNSPDQDFIYFTDYQLELEDRVGRGLASIDMDNDGDFDLIISNNNQAIGIIQNNSNPDNWVGIIAKCHNRMDYGARLSVYKEGEANPSLTRTVRSDGSYASAVDPRLTLYKTREFDRIEIKWADNRQTSIIKIDSMELNQYNVIGCHQEH
ncbi:MAG: CRTAC1 family protein [Proteobacteria bacterium]|nr:CRTAC1 family protein [Pseudomonadota bacterium]